MEAALRVVLAGKPGLDLRRRAERLLDLLHAAVPPPDVLRQVRALEVLEAAGTDDARHLLKALGEGMETGTADAGSEGGPAATPEKRIGAASTTGRTSTN